MRTFLVLVLCCAAAAQNWEVNFHNSNCCERAAQQCNADRTVRLAYDGFTTFALDPANNPISTLPELIFQYFTDDTKISAQSPNPAVPWTGTFVGMPHWMQVTTEAWTLLGGCFYSSFEVLDLNIGCTTAGTGLAWATVSYVIECPQAGVKHVEVNKQVAKTNAQGLITHFELEYDEEDVASWAAALGPLLGGSGN
eukprot:TRINITY_DN71474_c0_g1_i1.p2 TRINITY_DN71474_c0_g1~~TRINITY_DN71474_c0_g1_i1.p2  ORF type:complete len:196 (+),score=14.77 TRINITY_DN71474_c0_g1_i1:63-650(+)